ncbi:uncharacterized protein THITE_2115474 [Thermothielavioides terrestris NRRL 8126]|uniref:Uncharacterized protein n=1 Tax=Thermothielavioides terrestris (strain ATCC 38088 / NRRL 8126) TaxID=578455 RepID=G2R4H3_THETT|nr:uncharacterized protein THITE_2115474 [Thermothielavioides terrestris NRRL 8126]AEO66917.1 hypothetical protein THITE_2115474 [Thermothielavioides terrestris NRRL 8126]
MGLFNFLSKTNGNKAKSGTRLKPPVSHTSYFASLAAQEEYSKGRDGLDLPDPLTRGRPQFTQSQLPLDSASENELPAAAPGVPRYREESVERPSTAPHGHPSSASFPAVGPRLKGSGPRRPPPLSFRTPRSETATAGSRPGSRGSISSLTGVLHRARGQSRSSSIRSGVGKAFKDILDAQSEIYPTDFRERIKASGAREYGEDVAERNMATNHSKPRPAHVQPSYGQSQEVTSRDTTEPFPAVNSKLGTCQTVARQRLLHSSSQRPLARPMAPSNLPQSNTPPSGIHQDLKMRDSGRRRSVNAYVPCDSENLGGFSYPDRSPVSLGSVLQRPLAQNSEDSGVCFSALGPASPSTPYAAETAPAPTVRTTRVPRDSVELAKTRVEMPTPEHVVNDSTSRASSLHSATRSCRSSTMASTASLSRKHQSLHTLRSSVSSSIASRDTILHATALSHPRRTPLQPQGREIHGGPAADLDPSGLQNDDTSMPFMSVASPSVEARPKTRKLDEEGTTTPRPPSRSLPVMPPQEMMANTTSVALPDDILEYPPPIRTRSMRGWSASSGTHSASESTVTASFTTASSRPFHRPPSLHTAGTSVDLDAGPASPALKHASPGPAHSDSLHDTGDIHSEPEHGDNLNPPPPSDAFNIDDYLSSDADSVTTPSRRPTAEGEEELLFNEAGYGLGGMQLPGLPDSFPSPSSPAAAPRAKALRRGRSSPVLLKATLDPELVGAMCWDDSMGTRVARGVPPKKLGRVLEGREKRRFVLDTAADEESASEGEGYWNTVNWRPERAGDQEMGGRVDDDDDDGYEADFVEDEEQTTSRRRTTKKRTRVLSALCSEKCAEEEQGQQQEGRQEQQQEELPPQRETADEKREAQTDVVAAVRLRKEVKRAQRLAGGVSSARVRRARTRMSLPVLRVEGEV